ncbi:MAG: CGLD27 family protein [Thermosynechococcaceae cyanobacterium]
MVFFFMSVPVSCNPVPLEQRPVNEYKSLQESCFFGWSQAELKPFITRLGCLWGLGWVISAPIAAASFEPTEQFGLFGLAASGGATFGLTLIVLRLYLGWSYVYRRLQSQTIAYEETGWYDGQMWTKAEAEWLQDRLVGTYQVQPTLQRLKYCFGFLGLAWILGASLWPFVSFPG